MFLIREKFYHFHVNDVGVQVRFQRVSERQNSTFYLVKTFSQNSTPKV